MLTLTFIYMLCNFVEENSACIESAVLKYYCLHLLDKAEYLKSMKLTVDIVEMTKRDFTVYLHFMFLL